jgi:glycosyltransferase involved in cell wall biosynthesis
VSKELLFGKKPYSHIVAIFPPSLFMLIVPIFARRAKLIGIVHDLQGVYAKKNAGAFKRIIFSCIKFVEKRAFKVCDKLIFLSEDMMKLAESEYGLNKQKNIVRYPFITMDNFENRGSLKAIIPDGQKAIVYSGALGEKQAPEKLAAFMEAFVNNNKDFKAYIFSQGPIFKKLNTSFSNIGFHSLVDECDLAELLLRSTIQVLPQETETSDGSLPSKLPNLLACGCKILCITDPGSELVRLLENYTRAKVSHSWQIEELVKSATQLAEFEVEVISDKVLLNKFTKSALVDSVID